MSNDLHSNNALDKDVEDDRQTRRARLADNLAFLIVQAHRQSHEVAGEECESRLSTATKPSRSKKRRQKTRGR